MSDVSALELELCSVLGVLEDILLSPRPGAQEKYRPDLPAPKLLMHGLEHV